MHSVRLVIPIAGCRQSRTRDAVQRRSGVSSPGSLPLLRRKSTVALLLGRGQNVRTLHLTTLYIKEHTKLAAREYTTPRNKHINKKSKKKKCKSR